MAAAADELGNRPACSPAAFGFSSASAAVVHGNATVVSDVLNHVATRLTVARVGGNGARGLVVVIESQLVVAERAQRVRPLEHHVLVSSGNLMLGCGNRICRWRAGQENGRAAQEAQPQEEQCCQDCCVC